MLKKSILFYFLAATLILSCKKGFENERRAAGLPETFMSVDTIFRSGENRLTTRVDANWWGNSVGGYIVGYEVSTDNMKTWSFTKTQDSSFLLQIPPGMDTADVVIYVRAIDNFGQIDPTPASTLFPIKNSKPTVSYVFSQSVAGIPSQNPVNVFPVLKYTITGSDPDGDTDIKEFELYVNDTTTQPVILPANTTSFLLVSQNPKGDSGSCTIYINGNNNPISQTLNNLRHNAINVFYIRATDKALLKSSFAVSPEIWVKKVISDLLVVNAYNSNKISVQNFYTNNLKNLGYPIFDTMQATEVVNSNYTQLQPDYQSQSKTFALFKNIVWFGDDASFSFSFGQRTTADFFNKGGKLFLAVAINSSFDPLSNFLDWTPVKNLVNPPSGSVFRVNVNAQVKPVKSGWPTVKSTAIIPSARPFEIPQATGSSGFDSLYFGGIIESKTGQNPTDWTGISTVVAKRFNISDGKTNFIVTSLPLEKFNGNSNVDSLFRKLFIDELGF